jgi:membrane fusion protein
MSWQVIGFSIVAVLAIAIAFLALSSYARVEEVPGEIALDTGVASIVATRPATVARLFAREGQHVAAGDPLIDLRSEEDLASGRTAPRGVLDALLDQDNRLARQASMTISAAAAEEGRLQEQIAGLTAELTTLETQISAQRRLVELAENDFQQVRTIASGGFISRRDIEARESAVLARRQQLAQLEQVRAAKRADINEARRSITQTTAAAQAQAAGVLSSRAALAQQRAGAESSQGYRLTSPVDGTVTAVTARLGQSAATQQPLMVIVPAGAIARAELLVPSSAIGFLRVGQEVRLSVDAYPHERFGTVNAQITEISAVAIARPAADGRPLPVYLVTAEVHAPWITAFGRRHALRSGMKLSARITTKRQSLMEWLFEPLYAVGAR